MEKKRLTEAQRHEIFRAVCVTGEDLVHAIERIGKTTFYQVDESDISVLKILTSKSNKDKGESSND